MENDHFITDAGSLIILSGNNSEKHAGVGFIIRKEIRGAVHSFDCVSARLAALKLRIPGGKIAIFNAYASQSGLSADCRLDFFII